MGKIHITSCIPETNAHKIYNKISEFNEYSKFINVIRDISVKRIDDNSSISTWEVNFENGILCWKERDFYDHTALRIDFEKYEGDIEVFKGCWSVSQEKNNSVIDFEAEYDLGVPLLEDILDPIAGEILAQTIQQILKGLFESTKFRTVDIQTL